MKKAGKLFSILTVCSVLSGCMTLYHVPQYKQDEGVLAEHKATLDFAYHGANYLAQAQKAVAQTSYFEPAPSAGKADYTVFMSVSTKDIPVSDFLPMLLSACTLYLIPVVDGGTQTDFNFFIVNNKDGAKVDLGKFSAERKSYGGIGVLLFGALISPSGYMKDTISPNEPDRYIPIFKEVLKLAAAQTYDKNSKLNTSQEYVNNTFRAAALAKKPELTQEDLVFVAKNAESFDLFSLAKTKVKTELEHKTQCGVSLSLIVNENAIVPKSKTMYWQLLDYYKTYCGDTHRYLSAQIGLNKEELIGIRGNPSSAYQINGDTETLSYKKSSLHGESLVTSETVYTLDRGIVTKVAQKDK